MEQFEARFFEDEDRGGFVVEAEMKRAWAAQIEVLAEIDRICRRNGIQYFADSGTLLGAIRHKGFIPWDDDIDIAMKREDYQRFLEVAADELPEGWELVNAYTSPKYSQAFTRVKNGKNYNLSREHLERFHDCPYMVGVDIFPLDYLPQEREEQDVLYLILQHCYGTVWKIKKGQTQEAEQSLQEIEEMCNVKIAREGNIINRLILLMDKLSSLYKSEEADELALLMFRPDVEDRVIYQKKWYDTAIEVPFENIMIPIPVGYKGVLECLYGTDYMVPKQIAASHDYPFYKRQKDELEEFRNRVVFIVAYDDERYLEECLYYIERLHIPSGITVEVVSVSGAENPVDDYNLIIAEYNARYKVYLDQRTFVINDMFLYEVLQIFREKPEVGMLGILGGDASEEYTKGRILLWDENGIKENNCQSSKKDEQVAELSGILIVTQYDMPWTGEGHRQAQNFIEKGYQVVVPYQAAAWCLYDCREKVIDSTWEDYYFYLRRVELCHDRECAAVIEKLLVEGTLDYKEHIKCVEKEELPGNIAAYYWEDFLLTNHKREKYLYADGEVTLSDREKNGMHIVVSFNHGYAVYASVMLQSLYQNNPLCDIYVHVLQQELTLEDKAGLEQQAESFGNHILFYEFERKLLPESLHVTNEWSVEAYFRLFMIDLLPQDVDRILYLDVDVIVNKPLYDFYFMNMQEYEVVACRDFSMVLKEEFTDKRKELFKAISPEKKFVYFNSGVMLVNVAALRGRVSGATYLEVIAEQGTRLLAPDQDVLNLVHWDKTGLIDEWRYDFFSACIKGVQETEVKQNVSIIHYAGPKPWTSSDISLGVHNIWWEYATGTSMAAELVYNTIWKENTVKTEMRKALDIAKYCMHVPFMSCDVHGIKYIGTSQDLTIMRRMYNRKENWSKREIDAFFELSKKYYGGREYTQGDIFIDVGGNIGTTSIYVHKMIDSKLKIIAFEPMKDNIRIFKANCILNDIDSERIMIVEKAASNRIEENQMEKNVFNPGMSHILAEGEESNGNSECIESTTLDFYLKDNGIDYEKIKYIWMDVEGYEGYAIDGAKEVLAQGRIPILMEFVPKYLKRQGCYELLLKNLEVLYTQFLWLDEYVDAGTENIRDIGTLRAFAEQMGDGQADIFLIK